MSQLSSHQALVDKSFTINKGTVQAGMLLEFVSTLLLIELSLAALDFDSVSWRFIQANDDV